MTHDKHFLQGKSGRVCNPFKSLHCRSPPPCTHPLLLTHKKELPTIKVSVTSLIWLGFLFTGKNNKKRRTIIHETTFISTQVGKACLRSPYCFRYAAILWIISFRSRGRFIRLTTANLEGYYHNATAAIPGGYG